VFNNDYLLNQKVDAKQKEVILTYGGRKISDEEIQAAKEKFRSYNISNATLEIKQGFEYLTDNKSNEQITSLGNALEALGKDLKVMQAKTDSMYIKDSLRIAEIKLMKDSLDKLNIPITKKRRRK
jgi:hypothetical protein